jgi:hypothetical protein
VGDYTLPQIETFLTAIDQEDRARQRLALITARAAQADGPQFSKILKEFG